jgi:hypothetical protein
MPVAWTVGNRSRVAVVLDSSPEAELKPVGTNRDLILYKHVEELGNLSHGSEDDSQGRVGIIRIEPIANSPDYVLPPPQEDAVLKIDVEGVQTD